MTIEILNHLTNSQYVVVLALLNDDFPDVVELMQIHLYHDLLDLLFPNSYHVKDENYLEHVLVLRIKISISIARYLDFLLTST